MFCPKHGCELQYIETQSDVEAPHDIYFCNECHSEWEWAELIDGVIIMTTSKEEKEVNNEDTSRSRLLPGGTSF